MASWDNNQYDQNATEIAKTFCAGQGQNGSNLTDLVEKVARDNSLSGEQIRRLARTANVKTFGVKFDEMKTASAEDRNVEFQLADENEVLRRLAGTAEAVIKTAYAAPTQNKFPDLEDDFRAVRRPVPQEEKTASTFEVDVRASSPHKEIMRLQRLQEEATIRSKQASTAWHYALEGVLHATRKSNWTLDDSANLEKTAVALYGVNVIPELNIVRRLKGEAELVGLTEEKVASLRDKIVVKETDAARLIKTASDARCEWAEYDGAAQLIDQRLTYWTSKLSSEKKKNDKKKDEPSKAHAVGKTVGNVAATVMPTSKLIATLAPDREEITQFMSGASEGFTNGGIGKRK